MVVWWWCFEVFKSKVKVPIGEGFLKSVWGAQIRSQEKYENTTPLDLNTSGEYLEVNWGIFPRFFSYQFRDLHHRLITYIILVSILDESHFAKTTCIWSTEQKHSTWTKQIEFKVKLWTDRAAVSASRIMQCKSMDPLWRSTWHLGMGLGPILECHNAFQWDLACCWRLTRRLTLGVDIA